LGLFPEGCKITPEKKNKQVLIRKQKEGKGKKKSFNLYPTTQGRGVGSGE